MPGIWQRLLLIHLLPRVFPQIDPRVLRVTINLFQFRVR